MAFAFHQTDLGKQFLAQLPPPLAQALEQIAQALPPDFDHEAGRVPAFFHGFMDGFWTPFEEICRPDDSKELKEATEAVRALERSLTQRLDQGQRKLLDQFCEAMNARGTEELERAFLIGYQVAIRLVLMGLLPLNTLLSEEAAHEG